MGEGLLDRLWRKLFDQSYSRKKKGVVLLISFAFSVILWSLVALNEPNQTSFTLPVQVTEVPSHLQLTSGKENTVEVIVSGQGIELLKEYLSKPDTAYLPLGIHPEKGILELNDYKREVGLALSRNFEIKNFDPMQIPYSVEPKAQKRLSLVNRTRLQMSTAIQLDALPILVPDSVTATGTESLLDSLFFWNTVDSLYPVTESDSVILVKIESGGSDIHLEPATVELRLRPQRYTEATITVPIRVTGIPRGITVRLTPTQLKIVVLLPFKQYEQFLAGQAGFIAFFPFKKLDPATQTFIPDLPFIKNPARVISRQPREISFVIVHPQG